MNENYCGRCHTFTTVEYDSRYSATQPVSIRCACRDEPDLTKDPNCLNPRHEHHDPLSPTVLSNRSIRESEEAHDTGVYDWDWHAKTGEYRPPADEEGTVCGHERVDGVCSFWGCPIRLKNKAAAEEERPFYEEPPRDQECLLFGCVWIRVGKVVGGSAGEDAASIEWGQPICMRCKQEAPEGFEFVRPERIVKAICPHCGGLL